MTALSKYAKRVVDDMIRDLRKLDNKGKKMNQVGPNLPQYQCHKKVYALKIEKVFIVLGEHTEHVELVFTDKRFSAINVTSEWNDKHKPQAGAIRRSVLP
jgi:hypothetical protein